MLGWCKKSHRRRCKADTCSFSPWMMEFNLWRAAKILHLQVVFIWWPHFAWLQSWNSSSWYKNKKHTQGCRAAGVRGCFICGRVLRIQAQTCAEGKQVGKGRTSWQVHSKVGKTQKLWFSTKLSFIQEAWKRSHMHKPTATLFTQGRDWGVDCF